MIKVKKINKDKHYKQYTGKYAWVSYYNDCSKCTLIFYLDDKYRLKNSYNSYYRFNVSDAEEQHNLIIVNNYFAYIQRYYNKKEDKHIIYISIKKVDNITDINNFSTVLLYDIETDNIDELLTVKCNKKIKRILDYVYTELLLGNTTIKV